MCTYSLVPITLASAVRSHAKDAIRNLSLRLPYPKCHRLHIAMQFENSFNTLMIDTITTHQPMLSHRLINLYFFQIVKERNSQ